MDNRTEVMVAMGAAIGEVAKIEAGPAAACTGGANASSKSCKPTAPSNATSATCWSANRCVPIT